MTRCSNCNHKEVCNHPDKWITNRGCNHWQSLRYTGKWTKTEHGFKCSECGEEAAAQFSYCPDCGASMMYEVL